MKRLFRWLLAHVYVRRVDQNTIGRNEFDNEDLKPHMTTEVGLKFKF